MLERSAFRTTFSFILSLSNIKDFLRFIFLNPIWNNKPENSFSITQFTSVLHFELQFLKSHRHQVIHLIQILVLCNAEQLSEESHHSLSTLTTIPDGDDAFGNDDNNGDNHNDDKDHDDEEDVGPILGGIIIIKITFCL